MANWKLVEDRVLREMAEDGHSSKEISEWLAKELGTSRSRNAVWKRAEKLGVKIRPDQRDKDLMARSMTLYLLQHGMSTRQIARVRKVAPRTVWVMIQHMLKDGLVKRVGVSTSNVKFVPRVRWDNDDN